MEIISSRSRSLESRANARMSSVLVAFGTAKNKGAPHFGHLSLAAPRSCAHPVNRTAKTKLEINARMLLPNVPDQRPGAADAKHETRAPSPGSLHLVCWTLSFHACLRRSLGVNLLQCKCGKTPNRRVIVFHAPGQSRNGGLRFWTEQSEDPGGTLSGARV